MELFMMRVQAGVDKPQVLSVRKLGKLKAEELVIAGKLSNAEISFISLDAFVELIAWQMLEELCEDNRPGFICCPLQSVRGRLKIRTADVKVK
jgi:hypothetical protein